MHVLRSGGLTLLAGLALVAGAQGQADKKREPKLANVTEAQLRDGTSAFARAVGKVKVRYPVAARTVVIKPGAPAAVSAAKVSVTASTVVVEAQPGWKFKPKVAQARFDVVDEWAEADLSYDLPPSPKLPAGDDMKRADWIAVVLAAGAVPALAGPPDLSGKWRLDPKRSDDARAQIEKVAGPAQVKSGGASGLQILPESNTRSEVERVELREWMLGIADQLGRLEIAQTPEEVKLYLGDEEVRIFYLAREHVRQDSRGRKLRCRAKLESERLVLEELGDNGMTLREVFTPVPANGWLVHALRFEHPRLKQPLELRFVYVKDAP